LNKDSSLLHRRYPKRCPCRRQHFAEALLAEITPRHVDDPFFQPFLHLRDEAFQTSAARGEVAASNFLAACCA